MINPETSPAASEPISHTQRVEARVGVEAAGVEAAGVEAAGVEVAGVEAVGVELAGVEAVGVETVERWISAQLHRDALERFVPRGARVLELSSGAPLTEVLHRLGCRLSVVAASAQELEAARSRALERGFEPSVERWVQGSIVNLEAFADASFDAVVAFGGALGHALERRDRALAECMRVLSPRGLLIIGVSSLWGSMHRHLPFILRRDLVDNRAVIRSGNVQVPEGSESSADPASAILGGGRSCHLFRAAELEAFLRRGGLELLALSASTALSTGLDRPLGDDPSTWSALLEYERAACIERGYLDSGTQLIAVARR